MRRPGTLAWLAFVAALLSLVPVLLVPVPGFVDAPAHLARHHILAVAPFGAALSRHFIVQWHWIANLGADIPATLLGRWLGGEAATRIVAALIAPLTIAGVVSLSRAAHGRIAASAMLALPFVLHQGWMYGFLNYGVGTALALLVAAWRIGRPNESLAAQLGLATAALVVCTAHLASWALLLLIMAGAELGALRRGRDIWPAVRRNAPLLVPLVPFLLWRAESGGLDIAFLYEDGLITKAAVFAGALRGTWMKLDFGLVFASVFSAVLALRSGRSGRVDRRLFLGGVLLAAATLTAPDYILGSWATDKRVAPIAIILFILSIRPAADPRRERTIAAIGLALFLVRVTSVTWAWSERSPMLEQRLSMLDAVPRGGRLGYIYVPANCDFWMLQPDEKLASYAVTRRDAFVNTLFMVDKARLVTIRDPRFQDRWTSDSQRVSNPCPGTEQNVPTLARRLEAMRRDRFDAIWVSGVALGNLPPFESYRVARTLPNETMLVQR
jgi:hypothetical protein